MNIVQSSEPFYHTVIYDFYTPAQVANIWRELEEISGQFQNKHFNGDPQASDNKLGLHLDVFYQGQRDKSAMLTEDRKIFGIRHQLFDNPFAPYLEICDLDYSFISYYPDKSYYKPHFDRFTLSTVTTFWKEPQRFEGGLLRFPKYDYAPVMKPNTIILFPSYETHEVTPIHIDKKWEAKGFSRYTLNQFMLIKQS